MPSGNPDEAVGVPRPAAGEIFNPDAEYPREVRPVKVMVLVRLNTSKLSVARNRSVIGRILDRRASAR